MAVRRPRDGARSVGLARLVAFGILGLASAAHGKVGFLQVTSTHPVAVQRGRTAEVRLRSNFSLDDTYAVLFAEPGVTMTFAETAPIEAPRKGRRSAGTPFRFTVKVPEEQRPGVYEYRVATRNSVSSVAQLMVTDYPVVEEQHQEGGKSDAQQVHPPVAICGVCERFEEVDRYRFAGRAGEELTIQIYAQRVTDRLHGMVVKGPRIYLMDPILTLIGPNGQVVAQNDNFFGGDSFIYCRLAADGPYTLEVRDARYAGDPRYTYCVEISDRPYAHTLFPLAIQCGVSTQVEITGHLLGEGPRTSLLAMVDDDFGWKKVRIETPRGPTNPLPLLVSPHAQLLEKEGTGSIDDAQWFEPPVGINGRLSEPDDVDRYRFRAKKGERFRFEVEARRKGSPLDSVLELHDARGELLAEEDDTGGSKDSRLDWAAPADGAYSIAVRDLHNRGGSRFVYHLSAVPAEPDFELFGEYYYALLAPGTRMMWFARIERLSGFDGPVEVVVEGLPAGVSYTPVTIPRGMKHCGIVLSAAADAAIDARLVRVVGRARIKDHAGVEREIERRGHVTCEQQSSGGGQSRWPIETQVVGVTRPLDLVSVTASPEEITLKAGGAATIDVRIERVGGFEDAVTLAMSFDYFSSKLGEQLPPGVTMSTESQARLVGEVLEGTIVLEASDKALRVRRLPIAVLARVSITFSITTNYASNPVYLTVE